MSGQVFCSRAPADANGLPDESDRASVVVCACVRSGDYEGDERASASGLGKRGNTGAQGDEGRRRVVPQLPVVRCLRGLRSTHLILSGVASNSAPEVLFFCMLNCFFVLQDLLSCDSEN